MRPQMTDAGVLVVDDDKQIVSLLTDCLKNMGFVTSSTCDPREAVALFRAFAPGICLVDFSMPYLNGGDLLNQFKAVDSQVEVIFLTGETDISLAIDLMKRGASDYLLKPVDLAELAVSVTKALEHRQLVMENVAYRLNLEQLVLEKTEEIKKTLGKLDRLHAGTLEALGMALDFRDQSTGGHSQRVAELTAGIAGTIGISNDELTQVYEGALLHDIGKLKVPDGILLKPGRLSEDEWKVMRCHPQFGFEFLAGIEFLRPAAELVYSHHEKFDGTGYPRGLKGTAIPVGSRIFAIVDSVDAMIYKRPYNTPMSFDQAAAEVQRCAGAQFDPELAGPALTYLEKRIPALRA